MADATPASRFDLISGIFADFEREPGFELDFAMRTSKVGDIIVAPPRPRQSIWSRGSVLRQRAGAFGLSSNTPFAAEVQRKMGNLVALLLRRPLLGVGRTLDRKAAHYRF